MKMNRSSLLFLVPLISFCVSALHAQDAAKATAPVAKIGSTILTEEDLRKEAGMSLYDAENALYQLKKNWVDQKVKNILFDQAAKEAGLSRAAWQSKEIDGKVTPPSPTELDSMLKGYKVQGSTLPPTEADLAKAREQATQYLAGQKRAMVENALYQQLTQKNPVELLFAKPEAPHIDITYAEDDPVRGPKNAPITIVEFTDFQCPYCKRSQDTLKQVETVYAGKVKVVERQYPLPFHNRAKPSAEAVLCAKDQGKFWEMHDMLFPSQSLEDADIQRFAKNVDLNMKKFDKCLSEHKYAARIESDIADGVKFGVHGTPHFFINGRPISGAQPFEAFKTAIDEELAKKKS